MSSSSRDRGALIDILVLGAAWLCAAALVRPMGDFPLNDDWSYAIAVRRLLEQGTFHPTGWTSMPLLTHVLWGALFCLPFGFSFDALRVSTLTASLAGIAAFYLLVKATGRSRSTALLAAFTLAFNPIYFALSVTFMTDVPFSALVIVATLCLVRAVRQGSAASWWLGAAAATAATLSRHVGVLLAPAFVLTAQGGQWVPKARAARWALAALAAGPAALIVYVATFGFASGAPAWYRPILGSIGRLLRQPLSPFWNAVGVALYLGLFTVPLVFAARRTAGVGTEDAESGAGTNGRLGWWGRRVALSAMITLVLVATGHAIPIAQNGNVLVAQGIGPLTLRDTHILALKSVPPLPAIFWTIVTGFGALGATLAVERVARATISARRERQRTSRTQAAISKVLLVAGGALAIPFVVMGGFDRYMLPLVPIACALVVTSFAGSTGERRPERPAAIGVVLVGLFAFFSVASTHDYLSWNRARWEALDDLVVRQSVAPRVVDGGFEFNGWYLYRSDYEPNASKSWWWVDDDKYVAAFGPIPGYEKAAASRYVRWLPPRTDEIVMLRRSPGH